MTPEKLKAKYPELFDQCYEFSIGQGWMPIVETLVETISGNLKYWELVEKKPLPLVKIKQIKERLGGLRFYGDNITDEMSEWILFAQLLSSKICEDCGDRSTVVTKGYIRNLCIDCAVEQKRRYTVKDE
jgi:hypothetical protein